MRAARRSASASASERSRVTLRPVCADTVSTRGRWRSFSAIRAALVVEVEQRRLDVPLVEHDQRRAVAVHREVGDAQVLRGDTVAGVADDERDVGALGGALRAQRRVVLDRLGDLRLAAHAGGVDDHDVAAVDLERQVDRVARRAGLVGDDHAVAAGEAVDERGLADVGPPDHGEADGAPSASRASTRAAGARRRGRAGRRCRGPVPRTPRPARRGRGAWNSAASGMSATRVALVRGDHHRPARGGAGRRSRARRAGRRRARRRRAARGRRRRAPPAPARGSSRRAGRCRRSRRRRCRSA